MSVKYYISFTSDLGKKCRIEFDIPGYSGDPIELDGNGCSILYDGSEMSDPVITSKASLSVNYHEGFLADTRDADDKQIPVTIWHGSKKWIGFLIADNRDETFDKTNYPVQLTCVDPFSYIRGLQKDLFRDTDLFGRQTIEAVIRGVFAPVMNELNIRLMNDLLPNDSTSGNILDQVYCFSQVFQDDNGLYINGYDIIEKIMTDLVMTALFFDGVLILRNNRYLERQDSVEVGLNEDGDHIFWGGNSELITRTRGAKETSRSFSYPDQSSLYNNPNFYYYDASLPAGQNVKGWVAKPAPWYDCTSIEYIGTGRERNPYGFRLTGIMKDGTVITEGKDSGPLKTTSVAIPIGSGITEPQHNFVLKIRFRYGRYPVVLDDDGNQRPLYLAVNLFCRDLGGSGNYLAYFNDGKTGVGNYSVTQWENGAETGQSYPRIFFPVENNEEIQEVEIGIPDVTNRSLIGPVQFDIILWNMGAFNNNVDVMAEGGGYAAYPQTVEYFSADMYVTREAEAYYNGNGNIGNYTSEETYITSTRNYSLINETKEISLNRSYYILNKADVLDKYNRGSLTYSDGSPIDTFKQPSSGYSDLSLLQYGAKSEMYFNRGPRNIIDAIIKGDVNIIEVLTSPKVIPGKYVCVKDEYDLYADTHDMTLNELKGSDSETDIIENFLSTN